MGGGDLKYEKGAEVVGANINNDPHHGLSSTRTIMMPVIRILRTRNKTQ